MRFYDWLITKKDWNNPVGGMARDVIAYNEKDKVKELDFKGWEEYLTNCNACNLVMTTFPLIWKKYEKYLDEENKENK